MMLKSINPSNYRVLGEVEVSSQRDVINAIEFSRFVQTDWANLGVTERVKILRLALQEFETRKEEMIRLESQEMGKPITTAASDFNDALFFANWYLDNAEECLKPETTFENETEIHQVYREPLGVTAVIIPWNYPFLMFIWTAFPNLIAGNTVVLKHSEETPLCGKFIEEVMKKILPASVFQEVYGDGSVGKMLVRENIDLIVFTGSTKTGKSLYKTAGKKFVRAVMEMGGSAPGIVFEDAYIDAAVKSVCFYRLTNAGQYCDGLKRLLVHKKIYNEVVEKIAKAFATTKVIPAADPTTELGPLVSKHQLDLLMKQVEEAKTKGARIITGGHPLEQKLGGAFFQPTVLTDISGYMKVWNEEVFGPVLPIIEFYDENHVIQLANQTPYGLGGYVYTTDMERAERVASQLQTGMVSINGTNYTTPWNPFGGYKNSGIGREHGKWGFHELTQTKVIAKLK